MLNNNRKNIRKDLNNEQENLINSLKQENEQLKQESFIIFNEKDILNDQYIKLNNELSTVKTKLFKLLHENDDLKYNLSEIRKIKKLDNKLNNSNTSNSDNVYSKKKKFHIDYHEVPKLSIKNMHDILINNGYKYNEIKDMHTHTLKQLINRINNDKMARKFEN